MKRTGRKRAGRPRAVTRWPRAAGPGVLVLLAAGRVPLVVLAAGILVLSAVLAAVIAGAAFAPSRQAPESAARTLDLLLRAVPGYRPPPCSRWLTVTSGRGAGRRHHRAEPRQRALSATAKRAAVREASLPARRTNVRSAVRPARGVRGTGR
jgi:hypothetical protein